tara:strand:+ start:575 stop:703 length:129 start_codon:yes stop_codon:yes gene_type:complete
MDEIEKNQKQEEVEAKVGLVYWAAGGTKYIQKKNTQDPILKE